MKKIKTAIIGFGTMGKIRYNYLKKLKSIEIVLIYDPFCKNIPKNLKTKFDINQIINSSNLDAVFICTPNYLNAKLTFEFLKIKSTYFVKSLLR